MNFLKSIFSKNEGGETGGGEEKEEEVEAWKHNNKEAGAPA